jgi:tetratricopeptide (TPR) repeat protein
MAVFHAPPWSTSEEDGGYCFALALANRSACLQRLCSFKLAISDIDLALESGYPEGKAFKLLERRAECLEQIGHYDEAIESYEMAISSLSQISGSVPKDKREKIRQSLKKKLAKAIQVSQDPTPTGAASQIVEIDICTIPEPNPVYPAAHAAVEIRYDPHFGRYAVATEDIPMGTPLINERPVTFALYAEKFGLNCQHCFKVIRAVVPCPGCSWVCFCSRDCRDEALESYHQYECPVLKLLLESGLNVYSFLALRAVCKEGLHGLLEIKDVLENRDETAGTAADMKDKVYDSEDIINLFNLIAQEDSLDSEEWFLRTFIACFLLKLLMVTSFFKGSKSLPIKDKKDLTKDQLYIAKLLLRLINIFPCNCHDISEIESPVPDQFAPTCNKVSLGAAVFPTLALFNHACKPDFMRCNRGNGVVCIANRHIRKGNAILMLIALLREAINYFCFRRRNLRKLRVDVHHERRQRETENIKGPLQVRVLLFGMHRKLAQPVSNEG